MPTITSNKKGINQLNLSVYKNGDDALLFWRPKVNGKWDQPFEGCIGFCIQRQRKDTKGNWKETEILRNRVGFIDGQVSKDQKETPVVTKPSSIWPFQRYDWTDHGANSGETVRYRIAAMGIPTAGELGEVELSELADSGWTEAILISGETADGRFAAYFNRGNVMSQYIARIMRDQGLTKKMLKEKTKEFEEPIRRFLSGELRTTMLGLLDEVIEDVHLEFYAALYELTDTELIDRLKKLRGRAHIVLANGSDKAGDGNKPARDALKKAKVDVRDRILGSKGLGHNKFAVIYNSQTKKATKCWSGSTNWSASGLCTQLNNGILISDPAVAEIFSEQWDRLAEAGDAFPPKLVSANDESPRSVDNVDVWFTRMKNPEKTEKGLDLQGLMKFVDEAKEIILYVMFQPGPEPLTTALSKASTINVKGVVSTVLPNNIEQFKLHNIDVESKTYTTALVQPEGITQEFGSWLKEVTRSEFLFPNQFPGIGHAITHAKMIVIDPFTDNCKVITGSHNFSKAASEANDENFLVVHGSKELAEFYSVACLATYEHYRYRAYVKDKFDKGEKPWSHSQKDPSWQKSYLNQRLISQLKLWVRE